MSQRLLGIMQGRLLPPVDGHFQAFPHERWAERFPNAAAAGLGAIEWIFDSYGLGANPIGTAEGISRIVALSQTHGIAVRSMCADYFMDFTFVRATDVERTERIAHLEWLLGQARPDWITRIVLPFVDNSAIRDEADCDGVIDRLKRVLPAADSAEIELHPET